MERPISAAVGALLALASAAACSPPPPPPTDAPSSDIAPADAPPPPPDAGMDADAAPTDAACAGDARPAYPSGPYRVFNGGVLPEMHFTDADGGDVPLSRYFDPCAAVPRLLVVRTFTAWSGPSRWYAGHTQRLRARPDAARITVLDLLALGETNLPATVRDLAAWRAPYDTAPDALAIDPEYRFRAVNLTVAQLPDIVLVNARTMRVLAVWTNPTAEDVDYAITVAIAQLDGVTPPPRPEYTRYDNRFSSDQWDQIRAMAMPPAAPPPDPTNAHADDPAAAALGRQLFNDASLSPSGTVSCATCHMPDRVFTDGRPTGVGVATGDRNTPSVLFAAYQRWQFWDGRSDTLWAQALGPSENPVEMNSSRLYIAHAIADRYAAAYQAVFGPLPPLADTARFPATGKPGDPAWEGMASSDRDAATRVFVNFGKAIEAFERTLRTRPAPIDAYAAGNVNALSAAARQGLVEWFEAGCIQCHFGPTLANDSFHNIQMPTGRRDGQPDRGRIDAIAQLLASPFRADGPFSDAPATNAHLMGLASSDAMLGQFHTTSLRGVALMGPWGHGGTFTTLEDLVRHYARIGMVPVMGTIGTADVHLGAFHDDDVYVGNLVAALRAMSVDPLVAP